MSELLNGKKLNILITGSNGFIGRNVCEWLKKQDVNIIGLGRNKISKAQVNKYISCNLQIDDIGNAIDDMQIMPIDAVIHLASDMRREPYEKEVLASNCIGTQRLIEFCEIRNIPVFIQLSSLPVIGKPIQHPIKEEHPLAPPTVYHITKCTQELLANYAWYTHHLRTISFRISAPVGIGMNSKTIFPIFVKNALENKDIIIYGKGRRKQTYIHVSDIASAIYKGIKSNTQGVFNLASNNLYSNYELANECIKVIGSSSRIKYSGDGDPYDDYIWDVSLEKIKNEIGYEPKVSMEKMILELCNYYRKERNM